MGDEAERGRFLSMVEKACAIARRLRELEVRPYGVVRIDSSVDPGTWAADPEANTKRIAETFREACARAGDQGELLAAEGEVCWGGMHSWKEMLKLLELVDRPEILGFQADMAHTLLYLLGVNAASDAILPADFDWRDQETFEQAYRTLTDSLRPWDHRFPRGPERCHGQGFRLPRQDRPATACPPTPAGSWTSSGRPGTGFGLRWESHANLPAHLLGRLHVPQSDHVGPGNLEPDSLQHDPGSRCSRLGGVSRHRD